MSLIAPRSSRHPRATDSALCTKNEYILIDISQEVRRFTEYVDCRVEDLSYDIVGILMNYSSYLYSDDQIERENLAQRFSSSGYVKNLDDMKVIIEEVVHHLYPALTSLIQSHGYRLGKIHQVQNRITKQTRMPHCLIVLTVI